MNMRALAGIAALLYAGAGMADVTEEERFSYTLEPGGRISLENVNGGVVVEGGDGDVVEIIAVKKADDRETLDGIEILIDARPDAIRIETRHPKENKWFGISFGSGNGGGVDYTLAVPAWAKLDDIESVNGPIDIRGVHGEVGAETVNGSIRVADLASDVELETVNGSIEARFSALGGNQDVEAESVNGRITLELPADVDASVAADTVNGGIDADDFGLVADKGLIGRDLRGEIGDGSARVKLSTVNGAIKLRSY